jgi:hypothetical protein
MQPERTGLCPVEVILQGIPVQRVGTLADNFRGPPPRRQATEVGEPLFGDDVPLIPLAFPVQCL